MQDCLSEMYMIDWLTSDEVNNLMKKCLRNEVHYNSVLSFSDLFKFDEKLKIQNSFVIKNNSFCILSSSPWQELVRFTSGFVLTNRSLMRSCTWLQKDWLSTVDGWSSPGSCFKGLYPWLIYILPLSHRIQPSACVSCWTSLGIMQRYIQYTAHKTYGYTWDGQLQSSEVNGSVSWLVMWLWSVCVPSSTLKENPQKLTFTF